MPAKHKSTNYKQWGMLTIGQLNGYDRYPVTVPDDVERREQGLPAKDDTITRLNKRDPKRFALKAMAGW